MKPFTRFNGRLIVLVRCIIVLAALSSPIAHAYSQLFEWQSLAWNPNGTGSLPRTYTNVGGRGLDVVVDIAFDPADRFIGSTPQADGANGLRNYLDFDDVTESTTFTFSFFLTGTNTPAGVNIRDLTTKDLDSGNYQDAITFSAIPFGGGAAIVPDQIQLYTNTNVVKLGTDTVYATFDTGVGVADPEGWATATYGSQPIQSFSVKYFSGPDVSGNPSQQFMWISDFTFFQDDYTSTTCSPGFTSISGTGTALGLGDDAEANVTLPFSFFFYDTSSTAVRISSNGGLLFNTTTGSLPYTNTRIPTNSPAPAILPFWDDLNPFSAGDVYYEVSGTAPNRRFIVEWNNVPHYNNTGNATFQAIMFEGSNNIFFVYSDVFFGNGNYDYGASATIGLNNGTGEAFQYSYNRASLNGVNGVCYYFPNDYGDAPSGYGDAVHNIPHPSNLYIGAAGGEPDREVASQTSAAADGDDTDGNDDENGVTFRSPAGSSQSIFADVVVTNNTGGVATVCGWLDTPPIGAPFTSADGQCTTVNATNCTGLGGNKFQCTLQWPNLGQIQGTTFARFRVSTDSLTTSSFVNAATDGEIEDYQIGFDFTPTAVTIGQVKLTVTRVSDFFAGLNVAQMDTAALRALLDVWDAKSAAVLTGANREALLLALRNYLDPDVDDQVAVLYWDTLEERGTIGFYVERRRGNASWQRINNDMLPGLITAPMGGEYQLADPSARAGYQYQYRLIEQEARGTKRTYGPYTLEIQ